MTKYRKNIFVILSFIVLSVLSTVLFLHTHVLYDCFDFQFHMKRLMELKESINNGQLLPLFSLNYFHGSAVMSMYPYISILPFMIIFLFTTSIIRAYYLFWMILIFCALLISFISSFRFNKNFVFSYLFSIIYTTSPLFTFGMFGNGDIGEVTSLIFLPLVLFGFINILKYNRSYLECVIGIVLMFYCQLASALITCVFIMLFGLINVKCFNKYSLKEIIKNGVLMVCLLSIIWVPILHVSLFNKIHTVNVGHPLLAFDIKGFLEGIGPFSVIAIVISLFMFKHFNRIMKQMYILSLIIVMGSSKLMPWPLVTKLPILNKVNQFQFASRFLIIPQILLCYIFSYEIVKCLSKVNEKKYAKIYIVIILLLAIISQMLFQGFIIHKRSSYVNMYLTNYKDVYSYISHKMPMHSAIFNTSNKSLKYFVGGYSLNKDYYPSNSIYRMKYINNNEATYKNNQIINVDHIGYNKFSFNNVKHINNLALPFLHYKGEHLQVSINGHIVPYHLNNNSLVTLNKVKRGKNILKIQYMPNKLITMLEVIIFMIGIILIFIFNKNKVIEYKNKIMIS